MDVFPVLENKRDRVDGFLATVLEGGAEGGAAAAAPCLGCSLGSSCTSPSFSLPRSHDHVDDFLEGEEGGEGDAEGMGCLG